MKREQLVNKFINFLDTCSDAQLVILDKNITKIVQWNSWKEAEAPEIPLPTGNGNGLGREDADEGTWGSLYRTPDA